MNKVHGVILSPFVRKVLLTLEYKGQNYENVPVIPGSKNPNFRAISPLGKVPVFEDDYGTLPDSSVICKYLESKYPTPPILPTCPREQGKALWFEEFSDSKLAELLGGGLFFELLAAPKLFNRHTDQAKVATTLKLLPPHFDYLEKQFTCSEFIVGNQLSIADLSLPNFFINAGYAGFSVDRARWPKLAGYLDHMLSLPLFQNRLEQEKEIVAGLKG